MVERDDRAPVASIFTDAALTPGATIALDDGPAHHVRVKRLQTSDVVRLTDGAGTMALGSIATLGKRAVEVVVERVEAVPRPPAIHLRVPVADRDRMLWLAEKATELGVASWQAVKFRRSASVSPRGEGPGFAEKVRARMVSALEQSGGAWLPRVFPDVELDGLATTANETPILLDAGGPPLAAVIGAEALVNPVLLFGPEGGLEREEVARLVSAGWRTARVATNTLRFETAGIAAVAVCRNTQLLTEN
jgi:16S rRNA (uracil1498-N3)-methyltransferase